MTDEKDLYPNVYRIEYEQMEGDNYAGGLVRRVTFLEDINLLLNFKDKNIICITPVFAKYLPSLSTSGIEMLMQTVETQKRLTDENIEATALEDEIKRAQEKLAKLRGE